jgi:hypothetical protein
MYSGNMRWRLEWGVVLLIISLSLCALGRAQSGSQNPPHEETVVERPVSQPMSRIHPSP